MRLLISLNALLMSMSCFSFTCYFTLAKDNCWTNYDVSVTVFDASTNKQLFVIDVPKGQSWTRQKFTCQPSQELTYQATFQPIFWQEDKDTTYKSLNSLILPSTVTSNETAWDLPVCYSSAFAAVPFPPDATTANCKCDFKSIPSIKP